MNLHRRVALVTGGAHRVGRAIALALAEAGASIAIHYHSSAEQAQTTLAEIQALQVEAIALLANLTATSEAERLIDETIAHFNQLDVLVCSAAIWYPTPLGNTTEADWDAFFHLNVRAPFFLAQQAAPHLRATQGSIVNIVDTCIESSVKHYTPYLASKAALAMVTHNLASELAPHVRVNGISPGPVLLPEDWNEKQRKTAAQATLLQRVGSAEDVAQAVVYLASAPYVTGVVLPVDGGERLK